MTLLVNKTFVILLFGEAFPNYPPLPQIIHALREKILKICRASPNYTCLPQILPWMNN